MICDNLLSAWQNRTDNDIFTGMLDSAKINVKETRKILDHAVGSGVLNTEDAKLIRAIYDRVDQKINDLMNLSGQ